jgi:hypothetical protein
MLKNYEEIEQFLKDDSNWETECLSKDLKVLTLKLSDNFFVKKIKVLRFDDYYNELRWREVCSEFYHLWKSYWVWGGNFNDYDLQSYIRRHNRDKYIKDFKLKGDVYNDL